MQVGEREEVGPERAGVGLLEAGQREWAGDEEARGWVGGWGGLVGVEGPAVVFWGAEAVAVGLEIVSRTVW